MKTIRPEGGCGVNVPAAAPVNEYRMRLGAIPGVQCTVRILRRGEMRKPRVNGCRPRRNRRPIF